MNCLKKASTGLTQETSQAEPKTRGGSKTIDEPSTRQLKPTEWSTRAIII